MWIVTVVVGYESHDEYITLYRRAFEYALSDSVYKMTHAIEAAESVVIASLEDESNGWWRVESAVWCKGERGGAAE